MAMGYGNQIPFIEMKPLCQQGKIHCFSDMKMAPLIMSPLWRREQSESQKQLKQRHLPRMLMEEYISFFIVRFEMEERLVREAGTFRKRRTSLREEGGKRGEWIYVL